jgi:hypothetical protein
MDDYNALKKQIRKKLVKLSINNGIPEIKMSLSESDYKSLIADSSKISVKEEELKKIIEEVRGSVKLDPKPENKYKVLLKEIKIGQHIKLVTRDEKGEAIEELIYLGENKFFLLNHERGSLIITDELKALNFPWEIDGYIDFEVYRNNERFVFNNELTVYRTKKLKEIYFMKPPDEFDQIL